MLTDFRSVLPALFAVVDTERGCGNDVVGAGVVGGGNRVLEGARSPVLGALFVKVLAGVDGGCRPDDFRVLATGSAGRAMVGGPFEGRLGLGSVVVILKPSKAYLSVAFRFRATRLLMYLLPEESAPGFCTKVDVSMLCPQRCPHQAQVAAFGRQVGRENGKVQSTQICNRSGQRSLHSFRNRVDLCSDIGFEDVREKGIHPSIEFRTTT